MLWKGRGTGMHRMLNAHTHARVCRGQKTGCPPLLFLTYSLETESLIGPGAGLAASIPPVILLPLPMQSKRHMRPLLAGKESVFFIYKTGH